MSLIVFLVLYLTPGDPAELMLGNNASAEAVQSLRHDLGLDQPFYIQYATWLSHVVRGDFGYSIHLNQPVLPILLTRFRATALLAFTALLLSTVTGVTCGILAATRQFSWVDRSITVVSLFGVSMPNFWLGLLLIIVFALDVRWFPPAGMLSPGSLGDPGDVLHHLILPAITLAAPAVAIVARLTRSSMLEVLRQDYVKAAYAKGLRRRRVNLRHALRNAFIPVLTVVGAQVGYLLGGTVIVETVFSWPGLGTLVVQGVAGRDFPVVQGAVLLIAAVFVLVNLIVDLLYGYIDPRIRYS